MQDLVDLAQLKIFSAVARHLSFTRAAEALHMSQPAVSLQVRNLEASLGARLFLRSPQHISLTSAGEELLRHAEQILSQSARLIVMMEEAKRRDPARISIGLCSAAVLVLMSHIFIALETHCERTRLQIRSGQASDLQQELLEHRLDLAMLAGPPKSPVIRMMPLCEDEIVLVVGPQHSWASRHLVKASELARTLLLVPEVGSGARSALDLVLKQQRISLGQSVEMLDQAALARGAALGVAPALLPSRAVEQLVEGGFLVRVGIEGVRIPLPVWLGHHQDKEMSHLEREIIGEILQFCDGRRMQSLV